MSGEHTHGAGRAHDPKPSRSGRELCARPPGLGLAAGLALLCGCGSVQRNLIFQKTIPVPEGRFTGPITLEVPRRAAHEGRDFEIETELRAACDPLLRVSFPDGEVVTLGADDASWQALLTRRATATAEPARAPAPGGPQVPGGGPPEIITGHWETIQTESWPGQRAFLEQRQARCGETRSYRSVYLNALDESGQMTFWAETPQEISRASITIKLYELVDVGAELEAKAAARAAATARVEVKVQASASSAPPPPPPPPKKESPPPPKVVGATWVPGTWVYEQGEGHWVWIGGRWDPPKAGPPPVNERPGEPPNVGSTWAQGNWEWEPGEGNWRWIPGHWNAPPPLVETPGAPPVPESSWVPGAWVSVQGKFEWSAGYWGKPTPRAETKPPPPYPGARWVPGLWVSVRGAWVWSPGYYEQSGRPPPPPRAETKPPAPAPGAVWLAGFYRWSAAKSDYDWVPGHWEIPPGEGYVWVADAPSPGVGISLGGHWELRLKGPIEVKGTVEGGVKVRP